MIRALTSQLVLEIEKYITAPGWLIEIETSPSYLRYSTRGTIDYGGYTWSGGATLSGVSELGISGQVQMTLPNIDNAATAIALSNTLRDVNVNIYALYDVDNTSPQATQLATMKIDGVEAIDKMRATLSLRMTADVATHLPDVVIGPPLCNYIPQDGSSITWGASKIIFER